jgi:RNA polymerase-binding transcription factor DksA
MDHARARALLAAERTRLQRLLQAATSQPQAAELALQRAEARLAAGTYGRSVRSGQPIPDERLEADPLTELTVEEAAAAEPSTLEESHDAVGLVSASHPFEVLTSRYHPRGRTGQRGGRRRASRRAEPGHPHRA